MRKILIILIIMICPFAKGQTIKPSDLRKQKQDSINRTNQDTKLPSEKRLEQLKSNDIAFDANDSNFNVADVPDKWKNKSAVVIYQEYLYSFLRKNQNNCEEEIIRKRIKLQDNAAVDEFSIFYYFIPYYITDFSSSTGINGIRIPVSVQMNQMKTPTNNIEIRIIKPNGDKQEISTDNAVETDHEIPYFFRPFYTSKNMKFMKLAIPNLGKGDIIDVYIKNTNVSFAGGYENEFPPFFFTLNSVYPVMKQKFLFKVDKGFYIDFNSYHGAPDITIKDEAGMDAYGRERNIIKTFEFTDKDRENYQETYYSNILRSLPIIKFQVYYIPRGKEYISNYFIGKQGEVKKSVTPQEINRIACKMLFSNPSADFTKNILKYIRKKCKKCPPEEKLKEVFYEFRYLFLKYYYNTLTQQMTSVKTINEKNFLANLYIVLKKLKYNPDLLVCIPNYIGTIDDLLLSNEIATGLKVNNDYFFPFNNYSCFNTVPDELAGTEALLISNPNRNLKNFNSTKIKLPILEADKNTCLDKISLDISKLQENITILKESNISGYFRENYYSPILYSSDYYMDDSKKYDINYKEVNKTFGNKEYLEEKKRKINSLQEQNIKQQKEYFEESLKDDFSLVSFDNFTLKQKGRDDSTSNLIFSETFTVNDLLSKAGNNYIFQVGKLIGRQLSLDDNDSLRTIDIFQAYPRTIENTVQVTLPQNISVEGINTLNTHIDNESCSFISTAQKEGNLLTIHTTKTFKKIYDQSSKWRNYYEALKAASSFTQKKIILSLNK